MSQPQFFREMQKSSTSSLVRVVINPAEDCSIESSCENRRVVASAVSRVEGSDTDLLGDAVSDGNKRPAEASTAERSTVVAGRADVLR